MAAPTLPLAAVHCRVRRGRSALPAHPVIVVAYLAADTVTEADIRLCHHR
ncbi:MULTISPECIES: hypothetical protein [Rhodococcus]